MKIYVCVEAFIAIRGRKAGWVMLDEDTKYFLCFLCAFYKNLKKEFFLWKFFCES